MILKAAADKSRNPFQVFSMCLCVIVGTVAVTTGFRPDSIQQILPWWYEDAWGWLILAAGVAGIVGIVWPKRVTGVVIEQLALVTLGGAMATYMVAAWLAFGLQALFLIAFTLTLSVACFRRWYELERALRAAGEVGGLIRGRSRGR